MKVKNSIKKSCVEFGSMSAKIFILFLCILAQVSIRGEPKKSYLINTNKCKIPNYDAFNDEILGIWHPQFYKSCSSRPLLTYITKTDREATLNIRQDYLPLYGKNITCCVSNVVRDATGLSPDDKIRLTECEVFENSIILSANTVVVRCRNSYGYQIYKNAHTVILRKTNTTQRFKPSPSTKPISILFVVIDSVSRLNLIRTMPTTRDYLLENNFIEMKGYNKIDDNTYPNFLALLTGFNKTQTTSHNCMARKINDLDNCPMIWKKFRNLGYVTAYGEDWGSLGTFNYNKKGFNKPPTDYHFRPYVLASELIGTFSLNGAPYCSGPESSGERQLRLALDFAKTFRNSPFFGIFWMNTFSHQAINTPLSFDTRLRTFFAELKAEGVLDDSIVVFLSDHGIRSEPRIRKKISGWFEERLPMNLISLPTWFKELHPDLYENLKLNSNELTSTFDLYMTLQHILNISTSNYEIVPSKACPKCVSLFDKVGVRSCTESGVPDEWCTCIGHLTPMNKNNTIASKGLDFVLHYMESQLSSLGVSHLCYNLELYRLYKAATSEISETMEEEYLFLNFMTASSAEYTVTLKYKLDKNNDPSFNILSNIIRLDNGDMHCIKYSSISHFCTCKTETTKFLLPNIA